MVGDQGGIVTLDQPAASTGIVGRARSAWRRVSPAVLVPYLPLLVLGWQGWDRRWITDDGFINFRVVKMVLAGHGPVFNVGERVEATTSTLWLWILVVGDVLLPLELEWVAVLISLGLTLVGLGLAIDASTRLWRGLETTSLLVPAGAAVIAVLPPVWDFATSGLEGGLTFAWIGAVAWVLARWATRPDGRRLGILGAVVVGLGPLVRPDMTLVSGVVLVGVLVVQWGDGGWRARLRLVGAALVLPVVYEIFRMGYYAAVVPNTALAKNASHARWSTGWKYLRDMVDPYRLWIPLLLVVVVVGVPLAGRALRQQNRRALVAAGTLPLAGVLGAVYVVRVGGDYMHARLLLPSLWAILVPFATTPLPRVPVLRLFKGDGINQAGINLAGWAGVLAIPLWAVVCAGWWRHPGASVTEEAMVVDGRAGLVSSTGIEHPVSAVSQGFGPSSSLNHLPEGAVFIGGQPVAVDPPDDLRTPAYASFGVGIGGYTLGPDYYVLDMLGLGDPIESRMVVERSSQPGHEKPMPEAWIAARISDGPIDPSVELPEPALVIPLYESAPGRLDEDAAAARQAIDCAALQELLAAVREPMTPGRFLDNVLAAPRLTRLDIPADPEEAEQVLC